MRRRAPQQSSLWRRTYRASSRKAYFNTLSKPEPVLFLIAESAARSARGRWYPRFINADSTSSRRVSTAVAVCEHRFARDYAIVSFSSSRSARHFLTDSRECRSAREIRGADDDTQIVRFIPESTQREFGPTLT